MGLCQGLQGSAQVVGVHVAAQLPVEGGAPPDVDRNGPRHAVNLVPPALWNVQGIPRLRKMSSASVRSVPIGTAQFSARLQERLARCQSIATSAL